MKLIYKGKYSGDESALPQKEHPRGYVPYKEPKSMKKLAWLMNGLSVLILIAVLLLAHWRWGRSLLWGYGFGSSESIMAGLGLLTSLLSMIPHELLHAVCFREEVWLFHNLKQGMLFVVGKEDMSKTRFVFMSLLPNVVFGFLPFGVFLIFPEAVFFGMLGAFSISAGAGDYMNIFNTLTQVPRGGLVYMSGIHTYWYLPGTQPPAPSDPRE